MASSLFAVVLLTLFSGSQEVSEQGLYASEAWRSGSPAVLVSAQGERSHFRRGRSIVVTAFAHSVNDLALHAPNTYSATHASGLSVYV